MLIQIADDDDEVDDDDRNKSKVTKQPWYYSDWSRWMTVFADIKIFIK